MHYEEVIDYMFHQLPMFHRIGKSAYKDNLDTAVYFDKHFNFPHRAYKTIHVAGTNGKGSVSHVLAAILQTAGYKTGLFTSPHLKDFRERIRVNGCMISKDAVIEFVEQNMSIFEQIKPSFFEMTSALGFQYFKQADVDIAIIEVGMGGRLDSTNIINPILSVITNIGFDHTEFLGNTLAKIATEKAGIIKPETPVIIGEYNAETWPVFIDVTSKLNSPITLAEKQYIIDNTVNTSDGMQIFQVKADSTIVFPDLTLDLAGFYQQKNVCTVLASVDKLQSLGFEIGKTHIYNALKQVALLTGLMGRWQIINNSPLTICDTGHNIDGITWVLNQLKSLPYNKLHIVIGVVNDKDISSILQLLPQTATYYFTNASIPRALEANKLATMGGEYGLHGLCYYTVKQGFDAAKAIAAPNDIIFVGGSTFVVAEVL